MIDGSGCRRPGGYCAQERHAGDEGRHDGPQDDRCYPGRVHDFACDFHDFLKFHGSSSSGAPARPPGTPQRNPLPHGLPRVGRGTGIHRTQSRVTDQGERDHLRVGAAAGHLDLVTPGGRLLTTHPRVRYT